MPRCTPDACRVALAAAFIVTCGFTVAGFQALLPALMQEGVYHNLCPDSPVNRTAQAAGQHAAVAMPAQPLPGGECPAQTLQLDLMFTLSISCLNMAGLFVGFYVARVGPRVCCATGAAIVFLGMLIFSFGSYRAPYLFTIGYTVMGCAGPFIAFPVFTLPARFKAPGTIFSIIIGAIDGSAGTMYLVDLLYRYTGLSLRAIFWVWLVCPVALFAMSFLFLFNPTAKPKQHQMSQMGNDGSVATRDAEEQLLGSEADDDEDEPGATANDGVLGSGKSTKQILVSPVFLLFTLWLTCYVTAKYFYMDTLRSQLAWLTDNDASHVSLGTQVFSVVLPAGIACMCISSPLLDKGGAVMTVMVMAALSLIIAVLGNIKVYPLQFITMVAVVTNRFILFAANPFILSVLYGDRGVNVLYGISIFIAAAIQLSNEFWAYLTTTYLDGSFLPVNLALNGSCVIVGLILAARLRRAL